MTKEELYKELGMLGDDLPAVDWDDAELLVVEIETAVDIVLRILTIAKEQKHIAKADYDTAFNTALRAEDFIKDTLDAYAEDEEED